MPDKTNIYKEASEKHERGEHEEAIKILDGNIGKWTGLELARAYCLWGYCQEAQGQYSEAKGKYANALASIIEGINEEKIEDLKWSPAEELKQKVWVLEFATVFNAYGDVVTKEKKEKWEVLARKQYERTVELCSLVIDGRNFDKKEPDKFKAEAHYRRAYALRCLKNYSRSEEDYNEAVCLYKDDKPMLAKALNGLGNLYTLLGRLKDASRKYNEAIKQDENFVPAINNLADALSKLGRHGEAREQCDKIKDKVVLAEFYDTQGCVYAGLGKYEESKIYFEKALEKKGKDPVIRNNYGEMLRMCGSYIEAERQFKEAIKHDPDFAVAYSNLGDLYREQGEYEEAEEQYKKAMEKDPLLPDAKLGLADLYISRDKEPKTLRKALAEIERLPELAKEWAERQPRLYLIRGYIYAELGRYDSARADFERCIKLARGNEEILAGAKAGLNALRRKPFEPQKAMVWAGVGLSSIAGLILMTFTAICFLYHLGFTFKKTEVPAGDKTGVSTERKTEVPAGKGTDVPVDKKTDVPTGVGKQAVFSVWDVSPRDWEVDFLLVESAGGTADVKGPEGEKPGADGKQGAATSGSTPPKQGSEAVGGETPTQQETQPSGAGALVKKGPQVDGKKSPPEEGRPWEAFGNFFGGATYIGVVIACLMFMAIGGVLPIVNSLKVKFFGMEMEMELTKPTIPASETFASSKIK